MCVEEDTEGVVHVCRRRTWKTGGTSGFVVSSPFSWLSVVTFRASCVTAKEDPSSIRVFFCMNIPAADLVIVIILDNSPFHFISRSQPAVVIVEVAEIGSSFHCVPLCIDGKGKIVRSWI